MMTSGAIFEVSASIGNTCFHSLENDPQICVFRLIQYGAILLDR